MQRVVNFGSVLQAYSLRQLLQQLTGAQVSFLDISDTPAIPTNRSVVESVDYAVAADYPPGILQKAKRWTIARLSAYNKRLIRGFMKKTLQLDGEKPERFDCVVVGSDEVFNHVKGVRLQLHGQLDTDKAFTYAAACGSARAGDIAPENVEAVRNAMRNFQAISVRDEATRQYVKQLYDGPVYHHLDPVLTGDLYLRPHRPVPLKKYLLVYAYGQRIRIKEEISAIQNYAHSKGLKTVAMGGSQFWCDLYVPSSPMRLLDYFYYADCVVTDTFHGAVFSILNQKQFGVIVRKTNENKLTGLLCDLQLTDRLVQDMQQLETVLSKPVDYARVQTVLQEQRQEARAYLKAQIGV